MTLKDTCTYIAAAAGLASGVLWVVASRVGVENPRDPPVEGPTADGAITVRSGRHHLLLSPTLRLQSIWNSRAAIAAAVAAIAQAVSVLLP
ncbi:hypothetical protein GOFOIKOB_6280 [Methylobacterium tardum]|uniref:Uncharacterized protein n=1 Tax=Methylobacterium tardum TaxID=374432 RepID=A0AA37TUJ9_9HYPH|nr:hypothetical protein GOFOIKOB_6280 [Methylobacterium tardum]GLS74628.1 hypothetical protein GCM10007890_66460 [Methylobacterium tardum]